MPSTAHPAAVVAAAASAAAGAIHAAAAGSHAELTTLSRLFAVAAVLQIGWAVSALLREGRAIVAAGAVINLAVLAIWVVTRTIGISAVEGLESGQAITFQDGLAAGLAALAVASILASVAPALPARPLRLATPVVVVAIALASVPAMATPHGHDDHGDVGQVAAGAHAHDPAHADDPAHAAEQAHDPAHAGSHGAGADHEAHHGGSAEPTPTDAELGYPASFVSFLDQAPTPEARARAEQLIIDTAEAMEAFPDEAAIQAAGFMSIGDGGTGWEHYINVDRIANPAVLDPGDIESIVLKINPDGTKEVASAMYLLPFGTTMADAPDIAGDLTTWHDHQNLCWEGIRVVGTTDATGSCVRGEFRGTQPMMHVWVIEHPCGPFAGIEGSHGAGCDHEDESDGAHPHAPGTPAHQD